MVFFLEVVFRKEFGVNWSTFFSCHGSCKLQLFIPRFRPRLLQFDLSAPLHDMFWVESCWFFQFARWNLQLKFQLWRRGFWCCFGCKLAQILFVLPIAWSALILRPWHRLKLVDCEETLLDLIKFRCFPLIWCWNFNEFHRFVPLPRNFVEFTWLNPSLHLT